MTEYFYLAEVIEMTIWFNETGIITKKSKGS
jgi:hypothetical protein